jgi:hypothetical protein
VKNFQLNTIEPQTHAMFKKLSSQLKVLEFKFSNEELELYPQSKIGVIDLDKKTYYLSDTVFIGYMFAMHNPNKTLLTLPTVLKHFDQLIMQEDSDLLDRLYVQAKLDKEIKKRKKLMKQSKNQPLTMIENDILKVYDNARSVIAKDGSLRRVFVHPASRHVHIPRSVHTIGGLKEQGDKNRFNHDIFLSSFHLSSRY